MAQKKEEEKEEEEERELKTLNKPTTTNNNEESISSQIDESSTRDTRPLLKPSLSSTSPQPSSLIPDLDKKFAPYVRSDKYGTNGLGPLPFAEKVILGFSLITLVPLRVVLAVLIVVTYYLVCRVCTAFRAPNREDEEGGGQEDYAHLGGWRREVMVSSGRFLARAMLFAFGFYWIHESYRILEENECKEECEEKEKPGAIVSNHVSYLDILYHMSSSFPSFVAKRSVGKLPLVGLISKCLGCVYVQRESKASDFKGVAGVVSERIRESHQSESAPMMMLFPEGTTTNGDYLLPFKTGAFLPKAPVLPVILRYPYQRFSPAWDTISGVRHIILLLCQFANYLEVTRLPIYCPSEQEKIDPKLYADNVRRLMAREGNLTLSDIGLPEKRIYHAALNGNNKLPSVMHQKDE